MAYGQKWLASMFVGQTYVHYIYIIFVRKSGLKVVIIHFATASCGQFFTVELLI